MPTAREGHDGHDSDSGDGEHPVCSPHTCNCSHLPTPARTHLCVILDDDGDAAVQDAVLEPRRPPVPRQHQAEDRSHKHGAVVQRLSIRVVLPAVPHIVLLGPVLILHVLVNGLADAPVRREMDGRRSGNKFNDLLDALRQRQQPNADTSKHSA